MFETGRICMKVAGREAGRFCVVIGKEKGDEKEFVIVTGPKIVTKVRRRKCNVHHLEPTPLKIKVKENAADNEVMKAFERDDIYKKLNLHKPTPEEVKLAEEAKTRHKEKARPKEEKKPEKKEEKKPEKKEEKPKKEEKKKEKHEKPKHKKEKKEAKPKKKAAKKKSKKAKKK